MRPNTQLDELYTAIKDLEKAGEKTMQLSDVMTHLQAIRDSFEDIEEELLEVHPILVPGAEQVDLQWIALPIAPGDHLRHRRDRRRALPGGRLRPAGESPADEEQADHHPGDRK